MWRGLGIIVQESHKVPTSTVDSLVICAAKAAILPILNQLQRKLRVVSETAFHHLGRAVRRSVIHYDHFKLDDVLQREGLKTSP